jgi:crotonobetainyl-CoA:carnitine CoA-transferase CaiB-like acyl-CoA transferase
MRNLAQLTELIGEKLCERPSADWIREFEAVGVPAGPINRIGDMLADPQVAAREMVIEVDHPRAGPTKALGMPIKFSEDRADLTRPAPLLGQHSREILDHLGYAVAEIESLQRDGAVLLG